MDSNVDLSELNADYCHVAIDVGGTNTRVCIGNSSNVLQVAKFKASSRSALVAGLQTVCADLCAKFPAFRSRKCCVAAAGPVVEHGKAVWLTNYQGTLPEQYIRAEHLPAQFLGPDGVCIFLNDLEAACHGIAVLNARGALHTYFEVMWGEGTPELHDGGRYCVMAVGTGLGTAAIHAVRSAHVHITPMEAGHSLCQAVGAAHPGYEEERDLFASFAKSHGRPDLPPEYEDFVSGRGLAALYAWVRPRRNDKSTEVGVESFAQAALAGDESTHEALFLHYRYLARCSQNLVATLQCLEGLFWCGDNNVSNLEWIRANISLLRGEFCHHSKPMWLNKVPLYSQIRPINLNLHGAMWKAQGQVIVD